MTVYYKMRQILLQNATAILLQNASGFLLQNTTVLLQNATAITKCDVYYKLRQYVLYFVQALFFAYYRQAASDLCILLLFWFLMVFI